MVVRAFITVMLLNGGIVLADKYNDPDLTAAVYSLIFWVYQSAKVMLKLYNSIV